MMPTAGEVRGPCAVLLAERQTEASELRSAKLGSESSVARATLLLSAVESCQSSSTIRMPRASRSLPRRTRESRVGSRVDPRNHVDSLDRDPSDGLAKQDSGDVTEDFRDESRAPFRVIDRRRSNLGYRDRERSAEGKESPPARQVVGDEARILQELATLLISTRQASQCGEILCADGTVVVRRKAGLQPKLDVRDFL